MLRSHANNNPHTGRSLRSVCFMRSGRHLTRHRWEAMREVVLLLHTSAWSEQMYMQEDIPEPAWSASAHRLRVSKTSAYLPL